MVIPGQRLMCSQLDIWQKESISLPPRPLWGLSGWSVVVGLPPSQSLWPRFCAFILSCCLLIRGAFRVTWPWGHLTGRSWSGSWGDKSSSAHSMPGEGPHTPCGHFVHKVWRGTVESPPFKSQNLSSDSKRSRNSALAAPSLGVEGTRGPHVWSWLMAWWGPSKMGLESCLLAPHGTGPWCWWLPHLRRPWGQTGRGRGQGSECSVQAGLESLAQSGEERPRALGPYHPCYAASPWQEAGLVSFLVWQPRCWVFRRWSTLRLPGGSGRRNSLCSAWNLLGIGGEWSPGSLTPWSPGVLRAPLACLHLTSPAASLRFVCSDVWSGCSKARHSGMGSRPEAKLEGGLVFPSL